MDSAYSYIHMYILMESNLILFSFYKSNFSFNGVFGLRNLEGFYRAIESSIFGYKIKELLTFFYSYNLQNKK